MLTPLNAADLRAGDAVQPYGVVTAPPTPVSGGRVHVRFGGNSLTCAADRVLVVKRPEPSDDDDYYFGGFA